MNKKILIGSIIAVVILILVSFTSVVGYNRIESDKKISPLFNIRSKRAIKENYQGFTCEYVGKGEEIRISIPKIDNKIAIIQEVIERISKMDDESYDRFISLVINFIKKNNKFEEIDEIKVVNALNQVRCKQEVDTPISLRNWDECTNDVPCTIGGWHFGCHLYWFLWLIIVIPYLYLRNFLCVLSFDCNTWI